MADDPRISASEPPWAEPPVEITNGNPAVTAEMRAARVAEWQAHSNRDRAMLLKIWDERHDP